MVRAIDRPMGYEVFNLGNGRPFLLSDFIKLVETCVGKRANIQVLPMQAGDVDRTCADITKARTLLGYDPQTPFEVGIARMADWYKQAFEQGMFDEAPEPHFPVAPDPVRRHNDDLELSSAVEKAHVQVQAFCYLSFLKLNIFAPGICACRALLGQGAGSEPRISWRTRVSTLSLALQLIAVYTMHLMLRRVLNVC